MRELISQLENQLEFTTAEDAVKLLIDLGFEEEHVLLPTGTIGNISTPIPNLLLNRFSCAQLASSVRPIIFCGGPPKQINWIRGSLLTLIMDKILTNMITQDCKIYHRSKPGLRVELNV